MEAYDSSSLNRQFGSCHSLHYYRAFWKCMQCLRSFPLFFKILGRGWWRLLGGDCERRKRKIRLFCRREKLSRGIAVAGRLEKIAEGTLHTNIPTQKAKRSGTFSKEVRRASAGAAACCSSFELLFPRKNPSLPLRL